MGIPAGHGPIPRVAMLNKAHNDPKGNPSHPQTCPEKKGVKDGLGDKALIKHEAVQHTLTQGGGGHEQHKEDR